MPKKRMTGVQYCKLCAHTKYDCPVYGHPTGYCLSPEFDGEKIYKKGKRGKGKNGRSYQPR